MARIARLVDPAQWDGMKPVQQADGTYLVSANPHYTGPGYVERVVQDLPDGEIRDLGAAGDPDTRPFAHQDACEAIDCAGQASNTTVIQLGLALSNARYANWPNHKLTALAEALRAALIAQYVTRELSSGQPRDTPDWPRGVNFAADALRQAEPWIRAALLGQ